MDAHMRKWIIAGSAMVAMIATVAYAGQGRSGDDVPGHECEHGQHTGNPHCQGSPTATATPTASPSPTVTATIPPLRDCYLEGTCAVVPTPTVAPSIAPTAVVTPDAPIIVAPAMPVFPPVFAPFNPPSGDGDTSIAIPAVVEAPAKAPAPSPARTGTAGLKTSD